METELPSLLVRQPAGPSARAQRLHSTAVAATKKHPLDVFHKPRPVALVMAISRFLVHHLAFKGVPFLAKIPGFHRVVGWIRACQIRTLDFPKEDLQIAKGAINKNTAGFLSPNHPELFTDMMVAWAVGSRVSSRMAFWAARQFVNGPLRPFWVRHNLIANTRCSGPHDYSLESSVRGDGVLLHPEGGVWWTSDRVQPLFPGIATLSLRAAKTLRASNDQADRKRPVYIAPVVWKYRFDRDVSSGLHREMDYIEKRLALPPTKGLAIAERFAAIQWNVLLRNEKEADLEPSDPDTLPFFERQNLYFDALLTTLEKRYGITSALPKTKIQGCAYEMRLRETRKRIFRIQKATDALKSYDPKEFAKANAGTNELMRVLGFSAEDYDRPHLTQEHIAESLKRLRQDLFRGSVFDFLRKWVPLPVGPRVVHVRACTPVRVDTDLERAETNEKAWTDSVLTEVRTRMQSRLDDINREHGAEMRRYAHENPLHQPHSTVTI